MALTKVGLKGLDDGTDGQIITYDANGNPVAVGPGTDGQVLTSTGAGSPPAFEDLPTSGATLSGSTDNTVVTVTGANAMQGESNVHVNGGILVVGHTASTTTSNGEGPFVQVKATDSRAGASFIRHSADAAGGGLYIGKSRNATIGSNTVVQDDDELGRITFSGDDGSDINSIGAEIAAHVDGTPGSNDMPSRLTFRTTADGAAGTTERMRIDSDGKWYKNTKQILLPLQYFEVNVTGSTNFNTTSSWPDTKQLVTGFTPVKGGSRLWVHSTLQTWWGATSNSSSTDVYARIVATNTDQGAGYNQVWKNSRYAGNFAHNQYYTHDSKHAIFSCVTASNGAAMDFKFQAYMGSTLSNDFNLCHTDEFNLVQIWEYDIT